MTLLRSKGASQSQYFKGTACEGIAAQLVRLRRLPAALISMWFGCTAPGRGRIEQALAFGASRRDAGRPISAAGARAALERLVGLTGGPGLLLLPALGAGLLLAGVPPLRVRCVPWYRLSHQALRFS